MHSIFRKIYYRYFKILSKEDRKIYKAVKQISGSEPYNLSLYRLAMLHSSVGQQNNLGIRDSNERLEYLGDAILGMVVAEYLFNKFPFKEEGFLTDTRSKIVNRESLNNLSHKLGLSEILIYQQKNKQTGSKSIYGDSLEAFIGAIYLDKGFASCRKFIIHRLIVPHFDLEKLSTTITNYKSKIIEWAQKENKVLYFQNLEPEGNFRNKIFVSQIIIDGEPHETGQGLNKKKAEQEAARKTIEVLKI